MLINARSVLPKLQLLNTTLYELGADICIVTETWLKDEECDNQPLIDFQAKTGYKLIRRDRRAGRGSSIGIFYNAELLEMTKVKIPFSRHEILAAIERRVGQQNKYACPYILTAGDFNRRDLGCLLYTSPSPRDRQKSRMPSSA